MTSAAMLPALLVPARPKGPTVDTGDMGPSAMPYRPSGYTTPDVLKDTGPATEGPTRQDGRAFPDAKRRRETSGVQELDAQEVPRVTVQAAKDAVQLLENFVNQVAHFPDKLSGRAAVDTLRSYIDATSGKPRDP